ncbi:hypothetical protein HY491_00785 [Candidatus Woesearchaeota archaeon]|nr:hypothetical protein [Candidatus Woesearchaeota archaeon]
MIKWVKEKLIAMTGSVSGAASILGSWQICHNACLGLIVLLGILGITVTGMPLLFLTKIAIPIWLIAVGLLLVTIYLYTKKKCISNRLLLFNSGLIIAGVPFQPLQRFSLFFWIVGGIIAVAGMVLFIQDKRHAKRCEHEKN